MKKTTIILAVLFCLLVCSCGVPQSEMDALRSKYNKLESDYESAINEINSLKSQLDERDSDIVILNLDFEDNSTIAVAVSDDGKTSATYTSRGANIRDDYTRLLALAVFCGKYGINGLHETNDITIFIIANGETLGYFKLIDGATDVVSPLVAERYPFIFESNNNNDFFDTELSYSIAEELLTMYMNKLMP